MNIQLRFLTYLVVLCFFTSLSFPQLIQENKYGLKVVETLEQYQQLLKKDANQQLINLSEIIPELALDIKYATQDNFTGMQLYPYPRAYMRLPAAKALLNVQKELNRHGLGLKIWDAYRPYSVTCAMWEFVKDDRYAADPKKGSRHNRGCAVDLTIIDLKTGKELEMPTSYDDFTEKAHHSYKNLPQKVIENRGLLLKLMTDNNFSSITSEWWHYDYNGWQTYYIMDINFTELEEK